MAAEMQTLGMGFTWEQLSAGQKFRTLNRTVTETDLMMFVGVTGMVEVIFTDQTFGADKGTIQGRFVPAALRVRQDPPRERQTLGDDLRRHWPAPTENLPWSGQRPRRQTPSGRARDGPHRWSAR